MIIGHSDMDVESVLDIILGITVPQHLNRNKGEMERADRAADRESSWRDWSDDCVDG